MASQSQTNQQQINDEPLLLQSINSKTSCLRISLPDANGESNRDDGCNNGKSYRIHKDNNQYKYTCGRFGAQGSISISKELTANIIPKRIKERIANVWYFMDKTTAIALFDGNILNVDNVKVINYGFHDKDSGDELYLVADGKINKKKNKRVYVMRETLYTKQQICDNFGVKENDLPRSCVDMNGENVANVMRILYDIFTDSSTLYDILFRKWHTLPVFVRKKTYNTRRMTFALTKEEFDDAIKRFVCNKSSKLIPIIMFSCNGYRVEYVQIIKIENNIDIGISYVYHHNNNKNAIKATGIHLDKRSMLYHHQLIQPNHHCHCLDEFHSVIDDLHIGNPDDDKNRAKDWKMKNMHLSKNNQELHQLNAQLRSEKQHLTKNNEELHRLNTQLMLQKLNHEMVTLLRNTVNTPITPAPLISTPICTPIIMAPLNQTSIPPPIITQCPPMSIYNNFPPNSISTSSSFGSQSPFPFPFPMLTPSVSRSVAYITPPSMKNNNSPTQNMAAVYAQFAQHNTPNTQMDGRCNGSDGDDKKKRDNDKK